ncbi:MAG: hypothetical protein ACODAE_08735, partial [Gemmatimonadota bacterium]
RPDLRVADLRGNLDTRLEKLRAGAYDAALLAVAGLRRLGRTDAIGEVLGADGWLPAAGQGALAVVARAGDDASLELLAAIDDPVDRATTGAERAFLRELEGGCQIPIGALAVLERDGERLMRDDRRTDGGESRDGGGRGRRGAGGGGDEEDGAVASGTGGDAVERRLRLDGFVASLDGSDFLRDSLRGDVAEPEALGRRLAQRLRERGADEVLARARRDAEAKLPRASAP